MPEDTMLMTSEIVTAYVGHNAISVGEIPNLIGSVHAALTGHRGVHVRLFNGWDSKASGNAPWPSAGGRPPTVWTISRPPHPFEIREYEVI